MERFVGRRPVNASVRPTRNSTRLPMNTRRLLGLCLIPVLLAVLDGSVTLIGQPAAYWNDHSRVLEGTPGFRILLTHSPAAFIAGHLVWQLAFVGMILLLPSTPALAISLMFTLNHTIGAFSWINRFHFPYVRELPFVINAIAAAGLALGICWWTRSPHDTPLWASLPGGIRWTSVALLSGVPILYAWPWLR